MTDKLIHDPTKDAPEVPQTLEEIIEQLGTFNPEDAITFAEEPSTMLGMLVQHGHDVELFNIDAETTVVTLPSMDVDVVYNCSPNGDTELQAIEMHDKQRYEQYTLKDFAFDDLEVTEEAAQEHYEKWYKEKYPDMDTEGDTDADAD